MDVRDPRWSNGITGQWVVSNDEMGKAIDDESVAADTLLLGRRTYEVFAASWQNRSNEDDPMAERIEHDAEGGGLDDPRCSRTAQAR